MNVLLIGYRGTGKTTVARLLAERLSWPWLDADDEVERRAGKSIAEIFAGGGESEFRDLESQVLADLVRRDRHVLALGGGAILRAENRKLIKQAGTVVWLKADPQTILARVEADATSAQRRPSLTTRGGIGEIRELLARREPFYRECATLSIDTTDRKLSDVAAEILAQCQPSTD